MADDIGPGDVVEAIRDASAPEFGVSVHRGDRHMIAAVEDVPARYSVCRLCNDPLAQALHFTDDAPMNFLHCSCIWRKIGGSRAETVRRFAEDLTPVRETDDERLRRRISAGHQ